MIAERWLGKECERFEKTAASDEGLTSWKPPEVISEEDKAEAVTLADYARTVITERNLKARTRIGYYASLANYYRAQARNLYGARPDPATGSVVVFGLGSAHPTRNAHAYGLLNMDATPPCETG